LTMIHRDVALAARLRRRLMDLADRCRLIVRQLEVLGCVAVGMSTARGP
jgi:hypothetical protein